MVSSRVQVVGVVVFYVLSVLSCVYVVGEGEGVFGYVWLFVVVVEVVVIQGFLYGFVSVESLYD